MTSTARAVDQAGAVTGNVDLPNSIFGIEPNEPVMHQALLRQLANARQGTASTKTRSEVRGGGRKPWRQKGTGRARQGSTRSPQWEGGGVVFGPHPRSYRMDMPRKQRRLALRSALSAKAQDGGLVVLEAFALEAPETRAVTTLLRRVDAGKRVLVVLGSHNEMLEKSARNIAEVQVTLAGNLSVRDLLIAETVIVTRDAIEHIEEAFA
jgi:large subunit ribosomal protein L4